MGIIMTYLLYGTEEYLIKKEVQKIQQEFQIDSINMNDYDLSSSSLKDIVEDALTFSIFDDKKMIIVENSYIFSATTNQKNIEQDVSALENYLDYPNEDTILIFVLNREKIDGRKKITTKIKKSGVVKEFNEITDIQKYVKELFKPYQINDANAQLFCDRVGKHLLLMEQEIEKIKIYKGNEKEITSEDITSLVHKNTNVDIFNFIDNIINKNLEDAIESYYEMIKLGEEPIKIVIMLANQIRIMYQSKELVKKGYREKDIAELLSIHPYRVKMALSKGASYSSKTLLQYLLELAQLDENIKKGNIDKNIALEMFILNY